MGVKLSKRCEYGIKAAVHLARRADEGYIQAKEIASILNIPEASVRTRLFRARAILKEKASSLLAKPKGRST